MSYLGCKGMEASEIHPHENGKGHCEKAKYISVATTVSNIRKEICIALLLVKQMFYGAHQVQLEEELPYNTFYSLTGSALIIPFPYV